jgi:HSP20 family protein
MRRNEEYMPARRERDLSPMSPFGGSGQSFFGTSPWQMMRRMQEDMDRVFSQFFGGSAGSGGWPAATGQQQGMQVWTPSVDISQDDKEWRIEADLPGARKEDVHVEVRDGYLVISAEMRQGDQPQGGQTQGTPATQGQQQGTQGQQPGMQGQQQGMQGQQQGTQGQQRQYAHRERRYGYFQRVLALPDNVDEENIRCEFNNGVLNVHVPKVEPRAPQGRRIPIGASEAQQGNGPGRQEQRAMAGAKGGEAASTEHQPSQAQQRSETTSGSGGKGTTG